MKKKLPIGLSTLSNMLQEGYVYVDKSRYVYELASTGKYYFLSRPRRFGKSLFVNILKEAFEGNKELFKGLWLYDNWDWSTRYPVIHISFVSGVLRSKAELEKKIINVLEDNQERLKVRRKETTRYVSECFSDLIVGVKDRYDAPVVILVDEYEKPILDNITRPETAMEMREGLKDLYSVMKDHEGDIRFAFVTGVSRLGKGSVFSGFNNLRDITIDEAYSSIFGYTETELIENFKELLADKDIELIKHWYNGYSWTGAERVYNPSSINNYLQTGELRNYWFETGTPTFLVELFKQNRYNLPQLESHEVEESTIGSFELDFIVPENILFHAGYLTIADSRIKGNRLFYTLTYPNLEVRQSLKDGILRVYCPMPSQKNRK